MARPCLRPPLADELRRIDLIEMADKSAAGYYFDFIAPLTLISALDVAAHVHPGKAESIEALRCPQRRLRRQSQREVVDPLFPGHPRARIR
jgi:hypothetical protein